MNLKKIDLVNGYPREIEGTSEWYYCKVAENTFCDLYEAEEIIKDGHVYEGMNCVLMHFPEGRVFHPFEAKENVYVDAPVFWEGMLYFLVVDFMERKMQIVVFDTCTYERKMMVELPLDEVEDCYNLMLCVAPVLLIRDGNKNVLEVVWPEKKNFSMSNHEVFQFRDGDKMYFNEWHEDPKYREETIVRDWNTGEVIERFDGTLCRMPNGDVWRL